MRNSIKMMDYTRLTQWGTWEGTVTVGGRTIEVSADTTFAVRDRSWGVRGVGTQAPTNFPPSATQIFWLWAPLHFDDLCTHLALFEHADGSRWMQSALVVPVLDSPDAPTFGDTAQPEELEGIAYELTWQTGKRQMESAAIEVTHADGAVDRIEFEPLYTFRMRGIGYMHPHWAHGSIHGELEVGGESIALDDFEPLDPSSIHVQTLCRVHMGDRVGVGVLEQLAFGPHTPTGLNGIIDGYRPS